MVILLDETGQFNRGNHEKYFVVGSFTVGDPNRTEKRMRSWYRTKFPKPLKFLSEIKFASNSISEDLRLKTLHHISNLDVRIKYVYLERHNIPEGYRSGVKIESGLLYTQIVGELLEMYLPTTDKEFRVFCDRRHLKRVSHTEFIRTLTARLLPLLPSDCKIQIEMINSESNANIQIADWITGALGRSLEHKKLGPECMQSIANNITGDKELFSDYWHAKKWRK